MRNATILLAVLAMLALPAMGAEVFNETFEGGGSGSLGVFTNLYAGGPTVVQYTSAGGTAPNRTSGGGDWCVEYVSTTEFSSRPAMKTGYGDGGAIETAVGTSGLWENRTMLYVPDNLTWKDGAQTDYAYQMFVSSNYYSGGAERYTGTAYMLESGYQDDKLYLTNGDFNLKLATQFTNWLAWGGFINVPIPTNTWVELYASHDVATQTAHYRVSLEDGTVLYEDDTSWSQYCSIYIPEDAGYIGAHTANNWYSCPFVGTYYQDDYVFADVPEPATLSLLALGGIGLLIRRRRNA